MKTSIVLLKNDSEGSFSALSSRLKRNLNKLRLVRGLLLRTSPGSPIARNFSGWCCFSLRNRAETIKNHPITPRKTTGKAIGMIDSGFNAFDH